MDEKFKDFMEKRYPGLVCGNEFTETKTSDIKFDRKIPTEKPILFETLGVGREDPQEMDITNMKFKEGDLLYESNQHAISKLEVIAVFDPGVSMCREVWCRVIENFRFEIGVWEVEPPGGEPQKGLAIFLKRFAGRYFGSEFCYTFSEETAFASAAAYLRASEVAYGNKMRTAESYYNRAIKYNLKVMDRLEVLKEKNES